MSLRSQRDKGKFSYTEESDGMTLLLRCYQEISQNIAKIEWHLGDMSRSIDRSIAKIERRLEDVESMIKYQPGGAMFNSAKEHFQNQIEDPSRSDNLDY